MQTVEQIFERIREAKNWQKQQLAEYIDVDPSTLSQKLGKHWNIH
jgi:transcriptional regulator with XRE-family HTH domain